MGKGSGGGGTNTVVQQSGPPADVLAQYDKLIGQANSVAQQPYSNYNGNIVAGFSPQQNSAFNTIDNAQGLTAPYTNTAANMLQSSTQPIWNNVQQFSPNTIQGYMSPYTSDVVNATEAQMNNMDAQQQQQVVGNAVSAGAWGGDRSAIAQSELANQQDLANNQTIAGLENQGYTTGLQEFNTQQQAQIGANEANAWLNSQGAFAENQLGTSALSNTLQGSSAQLQTGALQQQLAQEQLNVPYEQYLAQQAYPFQTTGWLSNISTGVGGSMGQTGSTTSPGPSTASQVAGLGVGGLSLVGATGGFTPGSGWLTGSSGGIFGSGAKRGGRIPHFDMGGPTPGFIPPSVMENTGVPDVSVTSIPSGGVTPAKMTPLPSKGSTSTTTGGNGLSPSSLGGTMGNVAGIAGAVRGVNALTGASEPLASQAATSFDNAAGDSIDAAAGDSIGAAAGDSIGAAAGDSIGAGATDAAAPGFFASIGDTLASMGSSVWAAIPTMAEVAAFFAKRGGMVPHKDGGGGIGGLTPAQTGSNPLVQNQYQKFQNMSPEQLQEMAVRYGSSSQGPIIQQALRQKQMTPSAASSGGQGGAAQPAMTMQGLGAPQAFADGGDTMSDDNAAKMVSLYGTDEDVTAPSSPGLSPRTPDLNGITNAAPINKPDPWLALAAAGFGTAAGTSPHALQNVGQGAMEGLKNWSTQKEEAAKESQQQGSLKAKAEELADTADFHANQIKHENEALSETSEHNRATEAVAQQEANTKARQKWTIDPNTGMPMNVYTGEMKNPYSAGQPGQATTQGAIPTDKEGKPSQIPSDYFSGMSPAEIVDTRNVTKKNQPKDLQNQQAMLTSLVDQKTKVDDLTSQIPIASSGDLHTLQDFADRNQIPVFSDPKRGAATVAAAYDTLGNVLDNVRTTFAGTGRVLQAEFATLKNELNAASNMSPEQKAVVVGKIQSRLDRIVSDQLQYTDDVSSGMAYMPSRFYQSPMEKRLQGMVQGNKDKQTQPGATQPGAAAPAGGGEVIPYTKYFQ